MQNHLNAARKHEPSFSGDAGLLEAFNKHFDVVHADTPELRRQAHQIRYRVYCLETGFEDAQAFPDGLEKDAFDTHSAHALLIHRASATAMGTVRLVLPLAHAPDASFAVQGVAGDASMRDGSAFPLGSTAEVSRFCISRTFRRRAGDTLYDQPENAGTGDAGDRRSGPLMRLGLIQALVRMSARHGITHWCAVMEPTLLRMLDAMAIRFTRVGPPIEHHGLRQPCYCRIDEALEAVKKERPAFFDVLTAGVRCDTDEAVEV